LGEVSLRAAVVPSNASQRRPVGRTSDAPGATSVYSVYLSAAIAAVTAGGLK
jgi:hypothetical protein